MARTDPSNWVASRVLDEQLEMLRKGASEADQRDDLYGQWYRYHLLAQAASDAIISLNSMPPAYGTDPATAGAMSKLRDLLVDNLPLVRAGSTGMGFNLICEDPNWKTRG